MPSLSAIEVRRRLSAFSKEWAIAHDAPEIVEESTINRNAAYAIPKLQRGFWMWA
jgi:hypothetical protein